MHRHDACVHAQAHTFYIYNIYQQWHQLSMFCRYSECSILITVPKLSVEHINMCCISVWTKHLFVCESYTANRWKSSVPWLAGSTSSRGPSHFTPRSSTTGDIRGGWCMAGKLHKLRSVYTGTVFLIIAMSVAVRVLTKSLALSSGQCPSTAPCP